MNGGARQGWRGGSGLLETVEGQAKDKGGGKGSGPLEPGDADGGGGLQAQADLCGKVRVVEMWIRLEKGIETPLEPGLRLMEAGFQASQKVGVRFGGRFFQPGLEFFETIFLFVGSWAHVGFNQLNQIFEFLFQELSRTEDPCFDGAFAGLHDLGDFLIAQFLLFEKEDGGALVFGQLVKNLFKGFLDFRKMPGRALRAEGLKIGGIPCIKGFALVTAVFVDKETTGNLEEEGAEAGPWFVGGRGAVKADEDHLGEVFGLFIGTKGPVEEIEQGGLPAFDNPVKGGFLAVFELKHPVG